MQPTIRYAKSGAYPRCLSSLRDGAVDLVFVPGFISHLEHWWSEPAHARWLRRLGDSARVILFESAGRACRIALTSSPAWTRAWTTSAQSWTRLESNGRLSWGFQRPAHSLRCSPPLTRNAVRRSYFTAPSRVFPRGFRPNRRCSSSITMPTPPGAQEQPADVRAVHGREQGLSRMVGQVRTARRKSCRLHRDMRLNSQIDVSPILPSIHVPTLVIHRKTTWPSMSKEGENRRAHP